MEDPKLEEKLPKDIKEFSESKPFDHSEIDKATEKLNSPEGRRMVAEFNARYLENSKWYRRLFRNLKDWTVWAIAVPISVLITLTIIYAIS